MWNQNVSGSEPVTGAVAQRADFRRMGVFFCLILRYYAAQSGDRLCKSFDLKKFR